MHETTTRQVFLVDDDVPLRRSLCDLLGQCGYVARGYARAEDFLRDVGTCEPGCLLVDLCLPGMNGLDLLRAVQRAELPLSVVVMSVQSDVELAVATMREGALDYLEKPLGRSLVLERVRDALIDARRRSVGRNAVADVRRRFATLTPREQQVMRLMIEGHSTKISARQLGVSPRTIETHRIRVLRKMGVRTLSMLVRQGLALEVPGYADHLLLAAPAPEAAG